MTDLTQSNMTGVTFKNKTGGSCFAAMMAITTLAHSPNIFISAKSNWLVSLGCSLFAHPNITDLFWGEHSEILAEIGRGLKFNSWAPITWG